MMTEWRWVISSRFVRDICTAHTLATGRTYSGLKEIVRGNRISLSEWYRDLLAALGRVFRTHSDRAHAA